MGCQCGNATRDLCDVTAPVHVTLAWNTRASAWEVPDMQHPHDRSCVFCRIISSDADRANVFWEDDVALGLLNHRPLKAGHTLLMPKGHYATMKDLPTDLIGPVFQRAALLNQAVEHAFDADGSFSCYNTQVSQSVDHFHVHIVPRTFGDKLFSGGKWRRQRTPAPDAQRNRRDALGTTMRRLVAAARGS